MKKNILMEEQIQKVICETRDYWKFLVKSVSVFNVFLVVTEKR